jgi:hypothetical protein
MRRPWLRLVPGGKSSVRDDSLLWLGKTRSTLKQLLLRSLRDGDVQTAEHLSRCRDALARLEMEIRVAMDNEAGK